MKLPFSGKRCAAVADRAEDAAMNYRAAQLPLWGFLANTDIAYEPQLSRCAGPVSGRIITAGLSHQQQLLRYV